MTYSVGHAAGIGEASGYRGDGLRAYKGDASGRTYYLYDGSGPVCELDASANVAAENMFGANGLVSRNTPSGGTTWYAFDERGNVSQRVGSNGALLSTDVYDGFGNKRAGPADVFGFGGQAGYYTDTETGLILCTNRHYDPQSGRFLSRDPIGYGGGINLYSYTANNPVNWMDPDGTDALDNAIMAVAITTGGLEGGMQGGALGGGLGTLIEPVGGTFAGGAAGVYAGAGFGAAIGAGVGGLVIAARHGIMNMSGGGGGIETGPGSYKDAYPERYNGPKPKYDNPGTHDTQGGSFRGGGSRTTPLPEDAEEVYGKAIPDKAGRNWYGRGKDGDIYRYQPGHDGNHWNGREYSERGITVPSECRKRLGSTPKPARG